MKERTKADRQKTASKSLAHEGSHQDRPVLTIDYEKYAHFLEDSDLTEDQKQEFLQTLWNIIVEFVSLGWGVHPLQQAQKPCGQLGENSLKASLTAPDRLNLDQQFITENFLKAADSVNESEPEGVE